MHDTAWSQSNCGELVFLSQGLYAKNLLSTFIYPADSFLVAYSTILLNYHVTDLCIHSSVNDRVWSNFFTCLNFWHVILNYFFVLLYKFKLV